MAGRDDPSYDPRTWARPAAPPAAPRTDAPVQGPPSRRGVLTLGLGGGLIAAGGAGLMLRRRPRLTPSSSPAPVPILRRAPLATSALRRSFVIPDSSGLPAALAATGVAGQEAAAASAALRPALGPGELRVSAELRPESGGYRLARLEARRPDGTGAALRPVEGGGFALHRLTSDVHSGVKAVRGEMDANSFYTSAVAAGITDSLIPPFAQAFAFDFDLQREVKPGDIFEAVFEHPVDADGRAAGGDRLLYAALQTEAKSRALYRFKPASGEEGWFDGNGRSTVRSLMRTPVEGARISSTFGMRFHPILGYTRMHKGVDFAVAMGTPVYASGDGVIDFMGPHDGHGNFIRIRHNATLETGYAHLSKFGDGLHVGSPVRQGQEIARSGTSGLSTGPHLHYEVIVSGEAVDPLTFQTQTGRNLAGAELASFDRVRDRIDAERAAQTG
jgi:murein DD-endopeptidase MepM/ murein hydrolase activator NlpD